MVTAIPVADSEKEKTWVLVEVLAGMVTGTEIDPEAHETALGRPVSAGVDVRVQEVASATLAEMVTVPPDGPIETGESTKSEMVGAGGAETVAVVAAVVVEVPLAVRVNW